MIHASRARFLKVAGLAGASTLGLPLSFMRPASAADQIIVADAGGEYQAAMVSGFYDPFKKDTGVNLTYTTRSSLSMAKLKVMVDSKNVEWDLTVLIAYLTATAGKAGLLEKIDYSKLNTANMYKWALQPYGVGTDVYANVFAYSTKKWPAAQGPKSWADVWNVQKFPGRRSFIGLGYGPMEAALMADGVPMNKVYPIEVDRALKKMNEIKSNVSVWSTTGAQQAQLMLDGSVDIIHGWNGRLQSAIDQGAPYVIVWNQGFYETDTWVIPKGAPDIPATYRFLDYLMNPNQQAIFASKIPYGPTNAKAIDHISADRAKMLPTYPANLKLMLAIDDEWVSEHVDELQRRWTQWQATGA